MTPESSKSIGTAVPVFLVLTLVAWLYMLRTISLWIGRAPVPGRESDRMMAQLFSGILALLVWIFLAALLLIVSSKQAEPPQIGAIAWLAHPISLAGAIAAIVILYNPATRWPVVIPAIAPLLIGGYILYALFPSVQKIPVANVGYVVWAMTTALSISVAPSTIHFARNALDDGSIDATPGPKLDAWMAKQREDRRQRGLEELRKSDDETKLYELEHLIRPDSPVLKEALEFMRHQPNRQAEAVLMLQGQDSRILHFLGDIDLQPTAEMCNAARGYLRQALRERQRNSTEPSPYIGAEFTEGIESITWISKHCGCDAELAAIEAYARAQQQEAPDVQKFLQALTAIKQAK
jgi:hypothetical protein